MPIQKRKTIVSRRKVVVKRYPKNVPRNIKPKTTMAMFHRTLRLDYTNGAAANPWFPTGTSTLQMQLNSVPGYTDFTNLYNYYRISFIKYQFRLTLAPEAQTATTALYPQIYLQNYFTDQINWTTLAQADEVQKKRIVTIKPGRYVKHTIRPCTANLQSLYPLDASNPTGVSNYSAPVWKRWLPTTQAGIDYYGTKMLVKDMPTQQTLEVLCTIYVHTKDPK